jgi:hypothetical protein
MRDSMDAAAGQMPRQTEWKAHQRKKSAPIERADAQDVSGLAHQTASASDPAALGHHVQREKNGSAAKNVAASETVARDAIESASLVSLAAASADLATRVDAATSVGVVAEEAAMEVKMSARGDATRRIRVSMEMSRGGGRMAV